MIRVLIPLKPTVFSVKFVFGETKNKQREAGVAPFKKGLNLSFACRNIQSKLIIQVTYYQFSFQVFNEQDNLKENQNLQKNCENRNSIFYFEAKVIFDELKRNISFKVNLEPLISG